MTFRIVVISGYLLLALFSGIARSVTEADEIYRLGTRSVVVVETYTVDTAKSAAAYRESGKFSFVYKSKPSKQGSGVVVADQAVVTNCHVVTHAGSPPQLLVRYKGRRYTADLQHLDRERDLCQLRVRSLNLPHVKVGSTSLLQPGKRVFAIGAPLGLEHTMSEGIISALRDERGKKVIQTTAAISPGSSGGALFDNRGELIGITTSQLREGQTLNFALPAEWIVELPSRGKEQRQRYRSSGIQQISQRAMVAELRGQWPELVSLAKRLTAFDPYDVDHWIRLGKAHANNLEGKEAVAAFNKAIELDPSAETWRQFARAYLDLDWGAIAARARLELDQGETLDFHHDRDLLSRAANAINKALALDRDDAGSWEALGEIHQRLGDYEKSISALKNSVRLNPYSSSAWTTLMETYGASGDVTMAARAGRKAAELNEDNGELWLMVGAIALQASDFSLAKSACSNLRRVKHEFAERYCVRLNR